MKVTDDKKTSGAAQRGERTGPRARRWKLNPFVRRWLRSPCLGDDPWGDTFDGAIDDLRISNWVP